MLKLMENLMGESFDIERMGDYQGDAAEDVLGFSCEQIEIILAQNGTTEGTFTIMAPEGFVAQGYVFTSDIRMECLDREFTGRQEEIRYRFDAAGLEEGNSVQGYFSILSNLGEYNLPYHVTIETVEVESSLGFIKNMFHFTNLAKTNWEEAVKIFYTKGFRKLFAEGNDKQYDNTYKGLSAAYGNESNVEEFLLEINKKQRVEYTSDRKEVSVEDPEAVSEHSIILTRNGWGYTYFRIKADGEFISLEKDAMSEHDFLGNSCSVIFYVDRDKLHAGRNYGSITIWNCSMSITIPVTAVCNADYRRAFGVGKEKKRSLVRMIELYEAFRAKKITTKTWIGETDQLVERLISMDGRDINIRLFKAQLLITQERFNEAKWMLERIGSELGSAVYAPEIKCYYLYLTTLYSDEADYIFQATEKVEQLYRENPDSWRIAWLMIYLSEDYGKHPVKRFELLKEQCNKGCSSPIIYVEIWHLLEQNPTFLMKLGSFELQILNYAAKKGILTEKLMVHIRYLAQKEKVYSNRLFQILKECYDKCPTNETLQTICMLLIKGNRSDSSCFEWYRMGVEQELRITRLYEYYMLSLPDDYEDTLPKVILMYFAYQCDLDYRKKAFLYTYIYRRREEQPELYISYCGQIDQFVLNQIHKGRIDKNLAYLYKHIINRRMMDQKTAQELATLLFMNRISTNNRNIRQVIVCYSISTAEYIYPMSEGIAWVPLYGSDYKFFLEDETGCRYTVSVPTLTEKMMLPGKLTDMIVPFVKDHMGLDIYICEGNQSFITITGENAEQFRYIAASGHLEPEVKRELQMKLLHFYYEMDDMQGLDEYLLGVDPEIMPCMERNEVIRFMVLRGMYDKALELIKIFGIEGADAKTLVRLCSRLLSRDGFVEDEKLTHIIYYSFLKGKYDANIITYLVRFYNGTLKHLRDIRKAAVSFETESYELCEKMIVQMLFSHSFIGERIEIFREYVSEGAKTQVETAFLAQCSHDYFVKDNIIDPFIFMDMIRVYERGERIHKVCKLAFLKYYAENPEELSTTGGKAAVKIDEAAKIKASAKLFLYDIMEEKIYFPFFAEYVNEVPLLKQYADKTMIEYKVSRGNRAVIHYIIEKGRYTECDYRKEEMKDMYGGICVASFILFFGEKIQYYITEESEGKEVLTESACISKSDMLQDVREDRFSLINEIVIARAMQDYDTLDSLLLEYNRKEEMVSNIFTIQ